MAATASATVAAAQVKARGEDHAFAFPIVVHSFCERVWWRRLTIQFSNCIAQAFRAEAVPIFIRYQGNMRQSIAPTSIFSALGATIKTPCAVRTGFLLERFHMLGACQFKISAKFVVADMQSQALPRETNRDESNALAVLFHRPPSALAEQSKSSHPRHKPAFHEPLGYQASRDN